jgi:hypothetical protein
VFVCIDVDVDPPWLIQYPSIPYIVVNSPMKSIRIPMYIMYEQYNNADIHIEISTESISMDLNVNVPN